MGELKLPDIPKEERTPVVSLLLIIVQQQTEELQLQAEKLQQQTEELQLQAEKLQIQAEKIQLQAEEIQSLRDEIARLKKRKPKPKIKPSNLDKKTEDKAKKRGASKKKKKTKSLTIHHTEVCRPDNIPEGSKFIGYQDFVVQNIKIIGSNTRYRRARYKTPDGKIIIGQLPKEVGGHFGPDPTAFILCQYHNCHVTQPLIAEQLEELGVHISSGQISNILTLNKEGFHKEKAALLSAALGKPGHINVDDTGARHKGKNGYRTHIGNEYFAWFQTTESKSRMNFLELLRGESRELVINDDALEYMATRGLPKFQLAKLSEIGFKVFQGDGQLTAFFHDVGFVNDNHFRVAIEGALVGSIIHHGFNKDLAIISDGAGQFNVFLHGLCWVHAERSVHKLIAYNDKQNVLQEEVRADIWRLYKDLKSYRQHPEEAAKIELEKRFDELFTRKTGFAALDDALRRIHKNKSELLLVLERPDIPLHNNLSESDIREYVKRRKISGSTRSEDGKKCRDTFTSLKKTCRKLGVSFWEFLNDRIELKKKIPPLFELMKLKMSQSES